MCPDLGRIPIKKFRTTWPEFLKQIQDNVFWISVCGDGLIRAPLSHTLFCVAEDSKQDICVPQNVGSRYAMHTGSPVVRGTSP